jgi:hypothetical protein
MTPSAPGTPQLAIVAIAPCLHVRCVNLGTVFRAGGKGPLVTDQRHRAIIIRLGGVVLV